MEPKRVLFADNHHDFLDTRSEFLEDAGYQVLKAYTLEDAQQTMQNSWVHLAILDIRMVNDEDSKDTSGLTLAKESKLRPIPKIILTDYPDYEKVREALGAALDGLPPAVDFLAKKEGPKAMIHAVESAFDRHVHLNWDLVIRWREPFSFQQLEDLIGSQADDALSLERVAELESLFRKLCYDSVQVTLRRIHALDAGRVSLATYVYSDTGVETQYVISCGCRERIADENERFAAFVPTRGNSVCTIPYATAETVHFAATVYQLVGGDLDEIIPFANFYWRQPVEGILIALNHLYATTLASWHMKIPTVVENRREDSTYWDWLNLPEESEANNEFNRRVQGICKASTNAGLSHINYSADSIEVHLADDPVARYPNPARYLAMGQIPGESSPLWSTTHGKINPDTVLVDRCGQTWLIDFTKVGPGPVARDFVSLEMSIKLDLLETSDLQLRHELEKRLLSATALDDAVPAEELPPELKKALKVVEHIRHLAAQVAGTDPVPYLLKLYFDAMAHVAQYDPTVRHTRRELVPLAHSLLMAAMICEKLTDTAQTSSAQKEEAVNFWIDEHNKEVWVEGEPVDLTPQEFDMLAYLYAHRGQLCSRQAIVEDALGEPYREEATETTRLNSAISRLRQKLEPNPENPKYLLTVRGYGYRLAL